MSPEVSAGAPDVISMAGPGTPTEEHLGCTSEVDMGGMLYADAFAHAMAASTGALVFGAAASVEMGGAAASAAAYVAADGHMGQVGTVTEDALPAWAKRRVADAAPVAILAHAAFAAAAASAGQETAVAAWGATMTVESNRGSRASGPNSQA
eukprot:CAMPEP_0119365556 /NCGR_PEP_ID=MMETSP1334-20130426/12487_1 /TAXON_ID=127549 /ORGANISM="Calcidiscus leptoporus, Strain RCC1130" /LENGTH=151 /DNA_ID=CAMNT_0007381567 /DNA_START=746 /DNA_END=1202 /DNA_ORIENTATION=-